MGLWVRRTSRRVSARAAAITLAALLMGVALPAEAGAPRLLNAQGVLQDSQGAPAEALVSLAFTIYDGLEGDALWTELQDVTVSGGVFSTLVGAEDGNPLPADLFSAHDELWLGVQVESEPELPRQRLVSVAFAVEAAHAALADVALGLDCVGCVGVEQLTMVPASDADLAALATRVTTLEEAVAALQGPRLSDLNCGDGAVPRFDGGAWACLDGVATQAEVAAVAIDSVDGLAGGTITSATTVSGTLAADTLTQGGNIVCDASGNCGQTLAGLACAADEVVRWNGTAWACAAVPQVGVPSEPCVGANRALQWDGEAWACVDVKATGPSTGNANGYEVVDSWGYAWDGIERGAKTWAEAQAECETLGGRLPVPTELWRNNAASGTGDIATSVESSYLWTIIKNYQDRRSTVRLSDGSTSATAETSALPFRCVWPTRAVGAFTGDYCQGPKGAACVEVRRFYHIDAADRAPLDYAAAVNECAFFNASIPTVEDWADIIPSGILEGNWNWLFTTGTLYTSSNPRILHGLVRFDEDHEQWWSYSSQNNGTQASWSWPTTYNQFRCIGKRDAAEGVDPDAPACQDGCFEVRPAAEQSAGYHGRRAPIWADSTDRAPLTHPEATALCRSLGGNLPRAIEAYELIHAGWDNGTNEYLWLANPIYHGNYQNPLYRWTETGAETWIHSYSGTASWSQGNVAQAFRCVWHQTYLAEPHTCAAGSTPTWDGGTFGCAVVTDGDDGGAATDGGWSDPWGNRWDATAREAMTYPAAVETCANLGGRLPTATEIFRVNGATETPLPNTDTTYLWTPLPGSSLNNRVLVRQSDATTSQSGDSISSTAYPVRCIWPASHGNVLGGRACNGSMGTADEPTEPCLQVGRVTVDTLDRAVTYSPAAQAECRMAGGWIADLRTATGLIHDGLPNGDWNHYSWLSEGAADSSSNDWQFVHRWDGTGDETWYWNNQVSSTASGYWPRSPASFRCVHHDVIR